MSNSQATPPATDDTSAGEDLPSDQVEVVRSEEVLDVGAVTRVSGRVRLRKRVVTETVTQTVELRREELVVEREPVNADIEADVEPDAATGEVAGEHPFADGDVDVLLYAEQVVVTKRTVPVERVRLRTRTVTESVDVSDTVRREQVEVVTDEDLPA